MVIWAVIRTPQLQVATQRNGPPPGREWAVPSFLGLFISAGRVGEHVLPTSAEQWDRLTRQDPYRQLLDHIVLVLVEVGFL
jgi:hypothetical protein